MVALAEVGFVIVVVSRAFILNCIAALFVGGNWAVVRAAEPAVRWLDGRQLGPFALRSAYPLGGDAATLDTLPPLEAELRRVLGLGPCSRTISLYLLADRRQHERYLTERFPAVPYRRALFVEQGKVAMVFAYPSDELAVDLRHETTHALLHADLPMVPLWLDEGLAEYFEVAPHDRALANPHLREIDWLVRTGRVSRLDRLQRKQGLEDLDAGDYRDAWAWVHFLLHGPSEAHAELVRYLNDIRNRTPPGDFAERLERAVPHSHDRMLAHVRSWRELARQSTATSGQR